MLARKRSSKGQIRLAENPADAGETCAPPTALVDGLSMGYKNAKNLGAKP